MSTTLVRRNRCRNNFPIMVPTTLANNYYQKVSAEFLRLLSQNLVKTEVTWYTNPRCFATIKSRIQNFEISGFEILIDEGPYASAYGTQILGK